MRNDEIGVLYSLEASPRGSICLTTSALFDWFSTVFGILLPFVKSMQFLMITLKYLFYHLC